MRKPRSSVVLKQILLRSFGLWVEPHIKTYQEPTRAGTPKGDKIGLSRSKYACALLQALYGPFSLAELSKASFSFNIDGVEIKGASPGLIKLWRTEEQFREVANWASRDFANKVLYDVIFLKGDFISKGDLIERMILIEALILLPGFDIIHNELVDKLTKIIQEEKDIIEAKLDGSSERNIIRVFYEYLEDCLSDYCDIVMMMIEYTPDSKMRNLQAKVFKLINPIKLPIENIVKKAKTNGVIDDDYVQNISKILDFLISFKTDD